MDPIYVGLIMIALLGVLIVLGVHVGNALAILGVLGIFMVSGDIEIAVRLLGTTAYSAVMSYTFAVVPFFVAMGLIASVSGASERIYSLADLMTRTFKGGLAIATVFANAVFAAITGISVASAAVFSQVSLPHMMKHGYDKRFALGIVAGSSILGMLIPPSLFFIIYGLLSDEAIGRLFIAGIIPGILLMVVFSLGIRFMIWLKPSLIAHPEGEQRVPERATLKEILKSASRCWGIVALILLTMGGIWGGFFTPTEAGAVGAFGALVYGVLNRQIDKEKFWRILLETGLTTSSILYLLISAQMYARMLALTGMVQWFSTTMLGLEVPSIVVIIIFLFILLALGFFIDSTSIMLMTLPLMLPIVIKLGFDLIWFGVLVTVVLEMGVINPPFGLVVFSMKAALGDEVSVEDIFRGAIPFLGMLTIYTIILVIFPSLSTWLPKLVMG